MHTVELDDDVYTFLLRQTVRFGETISETLRRIHGIGTSNEINGNGDSALAGANLKSAEMLVFLRNGDFRVLTDATSRYLAILGKIAEQNPKEFFKIETAVSG